MSALALALLLAAATEDPGTLAPADRARIEHAQRLFGEYERRVAAFDIHVLDLYDPNGRVEVANRGNVGDEKHLVFTIPQLRESIDDAMHRARKKQDVDRFEQLLYEVVGDDVKIHGVKFCPIKNQRNPFEMRVGPNAAGTWRIVHLKEEFWSEGSSTAEMRREAELNPEGFVPPGTPLPGKR